MPATGAHYRTKHMAISRQPLSQEMTVGTVVYYRTSLGKGCPHVHVLEIQIILALRNPMVHLLVGCLQKSISLKLARSMESALSHKVYSKQCLSSMVAAM